MPNTTTLLNTFALALIVAVNSAAALAQNDRWFRVELLVFANESSIQPEGAAIAEQWDATPTLAYPLASRFLIDSDRVKENEAEFQGESLVDEYGRQIITIVSEQSLLGGVEDEIPAVAIRRPRASSSTIRLTQKTIYTTVNSLKTQKSVTPAEGSP